MTEVSQEFQQLAVQFSNANLPEYTALCYLAVSKCERALNNTLSEVHFLLRSARAFREADRTIDRLHLRSNSNEYLNGALNCYNQAIQSLDDESVMKAAIIREMKQIQSNCEMTSNFASPAHRINDLELAANDCIRTGDYAGALDKLTEIYDDIVERKVQHFYSEVLRSNEVSRVLLILLLRLPPARQSPSSVKLLQRFSFDREATSDDGDGLHSLEVIDALSSLIVALHNEQNKDNLISSIQCVEAIPGINLFQQMVLKELKKRYE